MSWRLKNNEDDIVPHWLRSPMLLWVSIAILVFAVSGCAHYPVNSKLSHYDPRGGYRRRNFSAAHPDNQLLLLLSFSGGGTRAAAFSYGVLETLRDTSIKVNGHEKRLLDEVDWISAVSGGSFTAAYYGLYESADTRAREFLSPFLEMFFRRRMLV